MTERYVLLLFSMLIAFAAIKLLQSMLNSLVDRIIQLGSGSPSAHAPMAAVVPAGQKPDLRSRESVSFQ